MKDLIIVLLGLVILFTAGSMLVKTFVLICGLMWAVYWIHNCDKIGNEKGSDVR